MSPEFARLVHTAVLESAVPAKELARKVGKPYSTLLREINPYDQGAKLGVETFVQLMKFTGDIAPVHYIARELGLELVPAQTGLRKAG